MTTDNRKPGSMKDAESFFKEKSDDLNKTKSKKNSKKLIIYSLIVVFFIIAVVRFFVIGSKSQEATYEVPLPDSTSIYSTIEMLEEYVIEYGVFPGDIEESINSSEEATLQANSDGSFTYTESGIVYTSPAGILH